MGNGKSIIFVYFRFTLADLPGSTTYIKNNLNHLAHADVGLLIVSPELGVDKNTRLFYHLANHFGVKMIVPVITTRPDTDEETLDLVKMELEESLDEETLSRVVVGNAAAAQTGNDDSAVSSIFDVFKNNLKLYIVFFKR